MWSAARCDGARWAQSHGRGPGADRPLPVIPDEAVSQVACGGRTMTRIGVGLNPLQGFRVCGQFEMTASVSISNCPQTTDRKSTRLNSSHDQISYAVFCLKKKKKHKA